MPWGRGWPLHEKSTCVKKVSTSGKNTSQKMWSIKSKIIYRISSYKYHNTDTLDQHKPRISMRRLLKNLTIIYRSLNVRIQSYSRPYSVRMRKNGDQNNSKNRHFWRSVSITMLFKDTINPLQLLVEKCKFFSQNYQQITK